MTAHASSPRLNRRSLLQGTAVAAGTLAIPRAVHAVGSHHLRIGLVGCGGRGVGAALDAVAADRSVVIVALGDRFPDQVAAAAGHLARVAGPRFAPTALHHGADAAHRVMATELDAVILATPPRFHPAGVTAAVAAGRHVFCELPVAADAAGVAEVSAAADAARHVGLVVACGLHARHHVPLQAMVADVASGAIGTPRQATVVHHLGLPWRRPSASDWSAADVRLRNWNTDDWLSGGLFVCDQVHAIDRAVWAMGDLPPVSATIVPTPEPLPSTPRPGVSMLIRYTFADGTTLDAGLMRRETIETQVIETVRGSRGSVDLRHSLMAGTGPAPHALGMRRFVEAIHGGSVNDLGHVEAACQSTLVALMGRLAAERGGRVAWNDLAPATAAAPARPLQSRRV